MRACVRACVIPIYPNNVINDQLCVFFMYMYMWLCHKMPKQLHFLLKFNAYTLIGIVIIMVRYNLCILNSIRILYILYIF